MTCTPASAGVARAPATVHAASPLIGYVVSSERYGSDALLATVAHQVMSHGLVVRGLVQMNGPGRRCDMSLKVLPGGPTLGISQNLGPQARGCRLDTAALEAAVEAVSRSLDETTDVLIVNKFGKHEASGHGFRQVIASAVGRGIVTILSTGSRNLPAFHAFSEGFGTALPAEPNAVVDWILQRTMTRTR